MTCINRMRGHMGPKRPMDAREGLCTHNKTDKAILETDTSEQKPAR